MNAHVLDGALVMDGMGRLPTMFDTNQSVAHRRDRLLEGKNCRDKTLCVAVRLALAESAAYAEQQALAQCMRDRQTRAAAVRSSLNYRLVSWLLSGPDALPPAQRLWRWLRKPKQRRPVGIASLALSDLTPDLGDEP